MSEDAKLAAVEVAHQAAWQAIYGGDPFQNAEGYDWACKVADAVLATVAPDPRLAQAEAALEEARAALEKITSLGTVEVWVSAIRGTETRKSVAAEIADDVLENLSTPVQRQPSPAGVRAEAIEDAAKVAEGARDGLTTTHTKIAAAIRALNREAGRG